MIYNFIKVSVGDGVDGHRSDDFAFALWGDI
jgi:hypothetical protein